MGSILIGIDIAERVVNVQHILKLKEVNSQVLVHIVHRHYLVSVLVAELVT